MNTLFKALIGVVCLVSVAQAEVLAPDVLIDKTVKEVIEIIKADKDLRAGNEKKVLALVDDKVLPNFDFQKMTQLAVGKHWRTASDAQKKAMTTEFRNMLVRTYTKAFTMYKNQTVSVSPIKLIGSEDKVTVKTTVNEPGKPALPVNYAMMKQDDGWKAFDVIIEGVSMVTSYRGTFDTEIQRNGIDGLIKMMANKNIEAANTANLLKK